MTTRGRFLKQLRWTGWCVGLSLSLLVHGQAPLPAVQPALRSIVLSMPEGSWAKVSQNAYSEAWAPADLRPLHGQGNPTPYKIIDAWSGFGWDTDRGDLILHGGGHQNYSGNDVYRWRSSTLRWERAALPSAVIPLDPTGTATGAVDGADAAPASAHTYDNNLYLPIVGRFMTWGGALYNTGGVYLRPNETGSGLRATGPYLFDPAKADPDKVGGTTGSHVMRVAPHPEVTGGNMWQNRDIAKNLAGQAVPSRHTAGCTAYAEEGGRDVVYVGASVGSASGTYLFRYVLNNIEAPTQDRIDQVGIYWNGTGNQTVCAYDPDAKLFVRTGVNGTPFVFWDLTSPGPANRDRIVQSAGSIANFNTWLWSTGKTMVNCGIDHDPVAGHFVVWCGGGTVWLLQSPPGNTTTGWTITGLAPTAGAAPPDWVGTGILGKWKYVPGYDVFVALENSTLGNVWIYKPVGWAGTAPPNASPTVAVTAPGDGALIDRGTAVAVQVSAADSDGSISKVEHYVNGARVAVTTGPPHSFAWTASVSGAHVLTARANDNRGGAATSAPVSVIVNAPPTVAMTAPAANATLTQSTVTVSASAADSDGTISKVEFFANGVPIAIVNTAPFTFSWSPANGPYSLTARATDNAGRSVTSAAINVTVAKANANALPSVGITAPANGEVLTLGLPVTVRADAADSDGTVASVEFFVNGASIGTDASGPFTMSWTPGAAGSYALTGKATDNLGGSATSTAVTVSVAAPNAAPTVNLTAPAGGAHVTAGTSVTVSANAADSDGAVSAVEFFANGVSIGVDSSAPFSIAWTPAAPGTVSLTAVARDDDAATTPSAAVSVTVDAAAGTARTVVLQRGLNAYAGVTDTMLSIYNPKTIYGSRTTLIQYMTYYTALLRFAVFAGEGGPVPAGATIQSAKLEIAYNAYNYTYRVHALKQAWVEQEATWLRPRAGATWAANGAQGAGADYEASADAEASVPFQAGSMSFDVTQRVRAIGTGSANFGWRIVNVGGYEAQRTLYASEFSTVAMRPKLTVTYISP